MAMIKGIDVILYEKVKTGMDAFHQDSYQERPITVPNVLVSPASSNDIETTVNLTGRKAVYSLAIPKTDAHTWEGCRVSFFGAVWRVIGLPQVGIEANIPLEWNAKVMVERYE